MVTQNFTCSDQTGYNVSIKVLTFAKDGFMQFILSHFVLTLSYVDT